MYKSKRKPGRQTPKNDPDVYVNSEIVKQFQLHAAELEEKQDRYERIVKISRDITIESKRLIFFLHTFRRFVYSYSIFDLSRSWKVMFIQFFHFTEKPQTAKLCYSKRSLDFKLSLKPILMLYEVNCSDKISISMFEPSASVCMFITTHIELCTVN